MNNNIYGQDILLDKYLQPVCDATGEVRLTSGVQTAIQDIKILLASPTIFYDATFRNNLFDFKNEENTEINRQRLLAEIIKIVNSDDRVVPYNTTARVESNINDKLEITVEFYLENEENPFNLVMTSGSDISFIISDINTYED